MITLGLDLSLVETGVVALNGEEIILQKVIKSKKDGDLPIDELKRLMWIVNEIKELMLDFQPDLVLVENPAMGYGQSKTTSLMQLIGLNYLVKKTIHDEGFPFVMVTPTTLKKFVTGKGNAPKDILMLETYKRYGVTLLNNNENDAFCLAKIGQELLESNEIPKFQEEVKLLLSIQL